MGRRSRTIRWLVLASALIIGGFGGARWLLAQIYPLEYRAILFSRAAEYGVDPYLVAAVIRTESGFKADATSEQGARGLMQIMPETGRWAAEQMRVPFEAKLLYDPDYNIRVGCWYLRNLNQEFSGDTVVALAAYNGGRSNVKKWLDAGRWTGEHRTIDQIPFPETRAYVAKVMRDYDRYTRIYAPDH